MESTPTPILDDAVEPAAVIRPETTANQSNEEAKDIFAEHSDALMDNFGKSCEDMGIKCAIAIVVNPQTGRPTIFSRGETYTIGKLVKMVLMQIRERVYDELSC